jgi:hypothetical protein
MTDLLEALEEKYRQRADDRSVRDELRLLHLNAIQEFCCGAGADEAEAATILANLEVTIEA